MSKNLFDMNNNQLIISAELLYLLQWLVDHEAEAIKKIIRRSFKKGLSSQFAQLKNKKEIILSEDAQNSIIDFIGLLEVLLSELIDEDSDRRKIQKKMMPAIEHIDSTVCDESILAYSLEEASSKIEKNPDENPQETLFKEILKNWNPQNK
ncbi:hypothetical protein HN446_03685 [bacterium]|jgi:hypothetical protein|nr:hypothetical protein [bacterium]